MWSPGTRGYHCPGQERTSGTSTSTVSRRVTGAGTCVRSTLTPWCTGRAMFRWWCHPPLSTEDSLMTWWSGRGTMWAWRVMLMGILPLTLSGGERMERTYWCRGRRWTLWRAPSWGWTRSADWTWGTTCVLLAMVSHPQPATDSPSESSVRYHNSSVILMEIFSSSSDVLDPESERSSVHWSGECHHRVPQRGLPQEYQLLGQPQGSNASVKYDQLLTWNLLKYHCFRW